MFEPRRVLLILNTQFRLIKSMRKHSCKVTFPVSNEKQNNALHTVLVTFKTIYKLTLSIACLCDVSQVVRFILALFKYVRFTKPEVINATGI